MFSFLPVKIKLKTKKERLYLGENAPKIDLSVWVYLCAYGMATGEKTG